MELQIIQNAIAAGVRKVTLRKEHIGHYLMRSMLAGLYLGLIVFLFWNLSNNLAASPFGKVVASLFFGVGLFVIIITNSELFTSNNMFLTVSSLAGHTSWAQTLKLWGVCWVGNLMGSILIALLLFGAGSLDALPADHALYKGALAKTEMTMTSIFFRGILANWVVCMAVWVNMHLKEDVARMFAIILIISIFLYLGFEHSIANMGTFSMSLLGNGTATLIGSAYNLLWATLGNIVGGGLFIGAVYWEMNKKDIAKIGK
ncbi:MAG: formate/nitrite transporter family protein [Bdellovibrionales bacterium]